MTRIYTMHDYSRQYTLIKRVVIAFILLVLLYRWYAGLLPYQVQGAEMMRVQYYALLHFYKFTGLNDVLLVSKWGTYLYTVALFAVPVLCFRYTKSLVLNWSMYLLIILYYVSQSAALAFSAHYWVGIIVCATIFLTVNERKFSFIWVGIRYWVCIMYLSAFLWKLIHGAIFQYEFGEAVFKNNLATYMYLYPDSWMTSLYSFCLRYPFILNIGTMVCFLIEGLFLIGLFTRKYDRFFILFILLLHHLLYLFVDTLFVEWYILVLPFLGLRFWEHLQDRVKH